MTPGHRLPPDTRPQRDEDLIDEDKSLLRDVEQTIGTIIKDCDTSSSAEPEGPSHGPWARLDHSRTPRILMIDGARGTGKTSLMLTLLDRWQKLQDSAAASGDEAPPWPDPRVARRVRALQPLDFDPLPPQLPLLAWIVQAFKSVVDWAVGQYTEPRRRAFADLDRETSNSNIGLSAQWQRLHDDAAVAWQPPEAPEAYERGEDHLRRVRKWSQFEREWGAFLDALIDRLREVNAWGRDAGAGILVLPIDDVDMQIARTPELVRALRLLHHRRLVFLLTGHAELLEEVLQQDYDGQRSRLGGARLGQMSRSVAEGLGKQLSEKVIRPSLRFSLPRLDLPSALAWRDRALIKATDDGTASKLAEHVLHPKHRASWTGLLSVTYRQLSDLEVELQARRQTSGASGLLQRLFLFRLPGVFKNESDELSEAAEAGGLAGVVAAAAGGGAQVELVARPKNWLTLLGEVGPDGGPAVTIAQKPVFVRRGASGARPLDRWLELWGRFGQDDARDLGIHVSWGGVEGGSLVETFSSRLRRSLPWPSPRFASWAGANAKQLAEWRREYESLWGIISDERDKLKRMSDAVAEGSDRDDVWEALLCAWVGHLSGLARPADGDRASPEASRPYIALPKGLPKASGNGDRLLGVLKKGLAHDAGDASARANWKAALLTLTHPAFEVPERLCSSILQKVWPLNTSTQHDPAQAKTEGEWWRRWERIVETKGELNTVGRLFEHLELLDKRIEGAAEESGLGKPWSTLLGAMPEDLYYRLLMRSAFGRRVAFEILGAGAWFSLAAGSVGFADQIQAPTLSFLSNEGTTHHLARMVLLPRLSDRRIGTAIWWRAGYAAEAVGRFCVENDRMSTLAQRVSDLTRDPDQSAARFLNEIYNFVVEETAYVHASHSQLGKAVALDGVHATPEGIVRIQHPHVTARLIDRADEPTQVAPTSGLHLAFEKRWTFEGDALAELSHAERHARAAWVMLASDVARVQGSERAQAQRAQVQNSVAHWIYVDGKPWSQPPLEYFFEWDMLRLRLDLFGAPPVTVAAGGTSLLWRLTYFIDCVFRLVRWPWQPQLERELPTDIDQLWRENGPLTVWAAFKPEVGAVASEAEQRRLGALAAWWLDIRDDLGRLLGDRISRRLKEVDGLANNLKMYAPARPPSKGT